VKELNDENILFGGKKMNNYKLLTPGPLTTTETVKKAMLVDHCTWDDEYKQITVAICTQLLELAHASSETYAAVLMQGSGSFGVESVLSSSIGKQDKLLVISNGAYGDRMAEMAYYNDIKCDILNFFYNETPDADKVNAYLKTHPEITHVAMVHCETTTGILNDIEAIGEVVKTHNKIYIVDAMSSFGGVDIEVEKLEIDFLISSANKCIQGVPGFSFVIAKKSEIMNCKGRARSLSLSLYDQYKEMIKDGKWRFTSPTHVVLAFEQALKELKEEGGIIARNTRFSKNMSYLRANFENLGIKPYLNQEVQSPIITTFEFPKENFNFKTMYDFIKARGFAIYPGKLLNLETFRIGVIGEIYLEDIEKLTDVMAEYLSSRG